MNRDGRFTKQYPEKKGACQTGFVPSSDECEAFNKLVLQKEGNEEVCSMCSHKAKIIKVF